MAKTRRSTSKKIAGEPPQGTGYDDSEMKKHLLDSFGISKPENTPADVSKIQPENIVEITEEVAQKVETLTETPEMKGSESEKAKEPHPIPTETKEESTDAVWQQEKEEAPKEEVITEPCKPTDELSTKPETKEPESPAGVPAGVLKDMRKLRERIKELEASSQFPSGIAAQPSGFPAYPGQGVTAQSSGAQPGTSVPRPPLEYDDEGRLVWPDPNNPEVRAYFRRLQEPTPEEQAMMTAQNAERQRIVEEQEFQSEVATFLQEDPRRQPIVERIQEATRLLDLRAAELLHRTGDVRARGPAEVAQFLEQYGAAQEFRQFVPEITTEEFPYFLDQVIYGSNLARRRYMTDFCNRLLGPKAQSGNGGQGGDLPKPPPAEIPPRLAAQGAVNPDRTGRPGKQERIEQLEKEKREDPWSFTEKQNKELMQLRTELGIRW